MESFVKKSVIEKKNAGVYLQVTDLLRASEVQKIMNEKRKRLT